MPSASRILAVFLLMLLTTAAALPPATTFAPHSAQSSQAAGHAADHPPGHAGCHGSKPEIPSPAPVDYQCCVIGHHAAIPSGSFSPRTPFAQVSRPNDDEDFSQAPGAIRRGILSIFSANGPPGSNPLRI